MKIGAERNKLILLAVVLVILALTVYTQFFASSRPTAARTRVPAARPAAASEPAQRPRASRTAAQTQARGQSFRPRFAPDDPEQSLDPMTMDPTLRTDLLARVRSVPFEGVERNLFQFGERKKAVPPPSDEAVAKAQERLKNLPQAKAAAANSASPVSKAPPIKFKYYGFANGPDDPRKRAFLLDGEEILIGTEGDVFKKRYRIVRIGVNSIVVEDLKFKEEQTLRLEES